MLAYVATTFSRDELVPTTRGDVAGILATGVLVIGLANALLFVGQQYATSAVAAIVFSLNPILTPVFAAALLSDERLSSRGVAGIGLGLVGVTLVVDPSSATVLGGDAVGRAILFAGAVSAALGAVLIRRADATLSSTVRIAWGSPRRARLSRPVVVSRRVGVVDCVDDGGGRRARVRQRLRRRDRVHRLLRPARFDRCDPGEPRLLRRPRRLDGRWLGGARRVDLGSAIVGFLAIFAGFAIVGSGSIDVRSTVSSIRTRPSIPNDQPPATDERNARKHRATGRTNTGSSVY